MCSSYRTIVKPPCACSDDELNAFVELVEAGGEVAPGLKARIERAVTLAMLYGGDELIGTAGIKRPNANYHQRVFCKAKTTLTADDYPFEVGWVYISPSHRGRRLTGQLMDAVIDAPRNGAIFSTTRANNKPMHRVLTARGFDQVGLPYLSREHPSEEIVLFVLQQPAGRPK